MLNTNYRTKIEDFLNNKTSKEDMSQFIKQATDGDEKIKPYDDQKFKTASYQIVTELGQLLNEKHENDAIKNEDYDKMIMVLSFIDPEYYSYLANEEHNFFYSMNLEEKKEIMSNNQDYISPQSEKYKGLIDLVTNYSYYKNSFDTSISAEEASVIVMGNVGNSKDDKKSMDSKNKQSFEDVFSKNCLFDYNETTGTYQFSQEKQNKMAEQFKDKCLEKMKPSMPRKLNSEEKTERYKNRIQEKINNFESALELLTMGNQSLFDQTYSQFCQKINSNLQQIIDIRHETADKNTGFYQKIKSDLEPVLNTENKVSKEKKSTVKPSV